MQTGPVIDGAVYTNSDHAAWIDMRMTLGILIRYENNYSYEERSLASLRPMAREARLAFPLGSFIC
jgi:hypothetical protein